MLYSMKVIQLSMARYNEKRIPYVLQEKLMNTFCDALARLKTKGDVKNFLKDLLNRQERAMIVRRLLIAQMLINGSTYNDIGRLLHCGTATIARVQRWVHFGRGGYHAAVSRNKK